jgi:SAM-dependent methyltransferase
MLAGLKQTTFWRLARGVKRKLLPPRVETVLSAADCRAGLAVVDAPVALEAGKPYPWRVRVENLGGTPWPADGPNPVRLTATWLTHAGDRFGEPLPFPLPRPVFPGEPAEWPLDIPTPGFVGDFVLEIDLDLPTGGAFAGRNQDNQTARVTVPVLGKRDADIDYHAVYRSADLGRNHWWVVGAYQTKDEYEKSSQGRLQMLINNGLTPDSRVLDIGCGTGQMADSLQGYLSDRGAYYGTDIGREAIAFCQAKFRRPNFVFRVGEMTRVPFDAPDGVFDLAIFFSVFTHTFADESALLLAETKRLLAPGGKILADVIVSPRVERGAGNRGEMIVNRDHFLRLAEAVGFAAEVIGQWPWNPHAERLMIVFRKR